MGRLLVLIFILIWSTVGYGLTFNLPKGSDALVGEVKVAQVRNEEDFSDVAMRFDVGYYEIFEANPGVDPDDTPVNTVLIVPTQYILPSELQKDTMVINLAEMRLYYRPQKGNKVYIFPVGIGKEDWETPLGRMTIVEKKKNPTWIVPDSIYNFRKSIGDKIDRIFPPGPDNPLGKYALRLSLRKFLIHGTNIPAGVGRRSTAGCIRLYEKDIEQLYHLVTIGTKVVIINKPYKTGWLGKKLYLEAHMPLFEQRITMGDDVKPVLDLVSRATKRLNIKVNWGQVSKIAKEHLTVPRPIN
ncbi:MAG: L,D-transpeptidase family protein [Gammaproteobacteria bacterium]|nr:L,D-transpeptidase family protein [Gammaproteobacteria bacterium]